MVGACCLLALTVMAVVATIGCAPAEDKARAQADLD
jgi:hypothetical protein